MFYATRLYCSHTCSLQDHSDVPLHTFEQMRNHIASVVVGHLIAAQDAIDCKLIS